MSERASRTSEMKVLSLDAAYSEADELEHSLRKVNGVRFALPASFLAVLGTGLWYMGLGAGGPANRSSAEWSWFAGFFGAYALFATITELRCGRRARALARDLAELRRWTED